VVGAESAIGEEIDVASVDAAKKMGILSRVDSKYNIDTVTRNDNDQSQPAVRTHSAVSPYGRVRGTCKHA